LKLKLEDEPKLFPFFNCTSPLALPATDVLALPDTKDCFHSVPLKLKMMLWPLDMLNALSLLPLVPPLLPSAVPLNCMVWLPL